MVLKCKYCGQVWSKDVDTERPKDMPDYVLCKIKGTNIPFVCPSCKSSLFFNGYCPSGNSDVASSLYE